MRFYWCVIGCLLSLSAWADNLRLDKRIVSVSDSEVKLEIQLHWANSWRNTCNYDAVYLFGKYTTDSLPEWEHVFFTKDPLKMEVSEGYAVEMMNEGRGLFVYRSVEDRGEASVKLVLSWDITAGKQSSLTKQDFDEQKVKVAIHGLEMVFVPTVPFYAGDGKAEKGFTTPFFGTIPPEYDLIATTQGWLFSANGGEGTAAAAQRAADRYDQAVLDNNNRHDWCGTVFPAWWRVDFGTVRKILWFGVSGICWQDIPCIPEGDWYLEGSNDAKNWQVVWQGGEEYWGQTHISYPVQRAIRVTSPAPYRYYQIRIDKAKNAALWNNVRIANVAMAEVDLQEFEKDRGVLIGGRLNGFTADYPEGVRGFYAMKYELTQEQYVSFLNQLSLSAQYSRTIGGELDGVEVGEYVFGAYRDRPQARNGIALLERRLKTNRPYVFVCDLNRTNKPGELDDGQTLACNFLSPADMLAYADWCGLRPLSELEYEKMCRGKFPQCPGQNEYAWETSYYREANTFTNEGTEKESPADHEANVNAGGKLAGPVRVGMFVREGKREYSGNSFWGIADLSGNLGEIYVNAGNWGKQLCRVSGDGCLSVNGETDVSRAYWPIEAEAYGIRGGDYSSVKAEMPVADRRHAEEYFKELTEHKPNVGVRLGISVEIDKREAVLTLANGLRSESTVAWDTVCGASDYKIVGDQLPQEESYLWFSSLDEGLTWNWIEGHTGKDLMLENLTEGVTSNTIKKILYKRIGYAPRGISEGMAGIVVVHGYQINHMRDTIQPCTEHSGFRVITSLPAVFEWSCLDNMKPLIADEENEKMSYLIPRTGDLVDGSELPSGVYTLGVKIGFTKNCVMNDRVEVVVLPYTQNPFSEKIQPLTFKEDGCQVVNTWGGKDAQQWTIVNEEKGNLSIDEKGLLTGVSSTFCKQVTVQVVCKDFPDRIYQKEIRETERTLAFTGSVQEMVLLAGTYELECQAAQGAGVMEGIGGLGGSAKGVLEIPSALRTFMVVGGTNGFNGGGASSGTGGGASDIRLEKDNLKSRIMVAGGGGGAERVRGGAGGGLEGLAGVGGYDHIQYNGSGGTQTAGGLYGSSNNYGPGSSGTFGQGGLGGISGDTGPGGGGGYYGGGGVTYAGGAGGGSGFISGFPGCDAVNEAGEHTGSSLHYSGYVFKSPEMKTGVRSGNGFIKITVK